jgi:hypothetical protein
MLKKFEFETNLRIEIDVKDPECLYLRQNGRVVLVDDYYGLQFLDDSIQAATISTQLGLMPMTQVTRVHKKLIKHCLDQAIEWLNDRFETPQMIPAYQLPKKWVKASPF